MENVILKNGEMLVNKFIFFGWEKSKDNEAEQPKESDKYTPNEDWEE